MLTREYTVCILARRVSVIPIMEILVRVSRLNKIGTWTGLSPRYNLNCLEILPAHRTAALLLSHRSR
jgi:hypothetical protein